MALSQNELFDVFSFLPAKSVHRFKCVSKSSSNFSNETYFELKQAQNMLTKDDTCFFVQLDTVQRYNEQIELHPLPGEQLSSSVSNDVLRFLSNSTRILDSSNGLILCRSTYKNPVELFICNPAAQSCLPIPTPKLLQENPDANLKIVLECSHGTTLDSDDYMVVHFEDPIDWTSNFVCNVYQPKDGVWKTMEESFDAGSRRMKFDMPVYYNGYIHFISDCFPCYDKNSPYFRPYIMSYNLDSGMSRMLRVPKEARKGSHDLSCDMSIFKWGKVSSLVPHESICLVRLRKAVFTIWVLTDYESCSWYRILKVRVKAMGLKERDPKVTGFAVMNGGVLIFAVDKKVYSYGLTSERYMMLEEICEQRCESIVCFIPYSSTLRPCGTGATTLPCKGCYTTTTSPGEENAMVESPFKVFP